LTGAGETRSFGPDPSGALRIWRRPGKGMFIGRSVRVTVVDCTRSTCRLAVEAPLSVVVTGPDKTLEQHLATQLDRDVRKQEDDPKDLATVVLMLGESARIGREATITYVGEESGRRASLSVEAPLNVAVTRDDYTFDEHIRTQERREKGGRR